MGGPDDHTGGQDGQLVTPMAEGALAAREMYVTLLDAGFTKDEALYLVSQFILGQR